jgi:hypothetical protein
MNVKEERVGDRGYRKEWGIKEEMRKKRGKVGRRKREQGGDRGVNSD